MSFLRDAVKRAARRALRSTGRAIERALLGDAEPVPEEAQTDPFAKLKALEKAQKERAKADEK